ncbi:MULTISPECIES: replication protein P [unclassified Cedecea]|uniref:replication protein P n=1 Tax=unclassified Cedecea TaxID=2649846 RepID=UPI00301A1D66
MRSLAEHMQSYEREQLSRVAHNLPEHHEERPQVEHVAQIFNELFNQLRAAFPAAMANFRTQAELNEFRRQWLLAFHENGINTLEQVSVGMRVARRQERPFLPSPGQFVAWCRAEESAAVGLPNQNELVALVYQYCRNRGAYPDAESYPWPGKTADRKHTTKSKACYWMVTVLTQKMRSQGLSDMELNRKAGEELAQMAMRIRGGEDIPEPVVRLPLLGGKLLSREQNISKLEEIRARFGFKKGRA